MMRASSRIQSASPYRRGARWLTSVLPSALLCVASLSSFAATAPATAEVRARYEQDRAKCLSGLSNQDQATCLKEAGAALDAAKQHQLDDGDAKYRRNAKTRCDALSGDEARDCRARMKGKGTVSGSVESGGVLRETVTHEVQPAADAASAAPPAASN
jgi:hypothetical protein